MREEITVKLLASGLKAIVQKAVFDDVEIGATETCSACGGNGLLNGYMCEECIGRGWIYDGTKTVEMVIVKYGLGKDGRWWEVAEGAEYPIDCHLTPKVCPEGY
jgi:DnaJ-class molecular chaperone